MSTNQLNDLSKVYLAMVAEETSVERIDRISQENVAKRRAKAEAERTARDKKTAEFQRHKQSVLAKGGRPVDALDSWHKKQAHKEAYELVEKDLNAAERRALPDKDFALPGKGKGPQGKQAGSYPIPDKSHARMALAMVAKHGTSEKKEKVRAAVAKKFPGIKQEQVDNLQEKDLTAAERRALPDSDFALPGKGKGPEGKQAGSYPIPDKSHARLALAMVAKYGSSAEKAKVRAAVEKKFPGIKIEEGKDTPDQVKAVIAYDRARKGTDDATYDSLHGKKKQAKKERDYAKWQRDKGAEDAQKSGHPWEHAKGSTREKEGKKSEKHAHIKDSFSNWRNDLREVAYQTGVAPQEYVDEPQSKAEKEVKEKRVKNKVIINPTFQEAINDIGGEVLDAVEINEKEVKVKDTYKTVAAIVDYDRAKKGSKYADYDSLHGKKKEAKKERDYAAWERSKMKRDDPNWKHKKYHTGMHGESLEVVEGNGEPTDTQGKGVVKKELKALKKGAQTLKGKYVAKADAIQESDADEYIEIVTKVKKSELEADIKRWAVDEAVKGEDTQRRKDAAADRRAGKDKLLSKKTGESYAKWTMRRHPKDVDEDKKWGYDKDGNSLNPADIEKKRRKEDDLFGSPNSKKKAKIEEQSNPGDTRPQSPTEDKGDPALESKKKRAEQLKKQVLMRKLQAVRQGGGSEITASYEPDVEGAVEYFYEEGINEDGLQMIIEEVGLEDLVDFVEERAARKMNVRTKGSIKKQVEKDAAAEAKRREQKKGEYAETPKKKPKIGLSYATKVKPAAKKKAPVTKPVAKKVSKKDYDGDGKKETPKQEHRGVRNKKIAQAVAKAKPAQPKKEVSKGGLRDKLKSAYKAGVKRHRKATQPVRVFHKGMKSGARTAVKAAKDVKKAVVGEEIETEGWKPDPVEKRKKKAADLHRRETIASATPAKYKTDKTEDPDKLYKRRMAVDSKTKMREELAVDTGTAAVREKKKKTLDRIKKDAKDILKQDEIHSKIEEERDPPSQFEKGDDDRGNPAYMKTSSMKDEEKWERLQRMRKASKKASVRVKATEEVQDIVKGVKKNFGAEGLAKKKHKEKFGGVAEAKVDTGSAEEKATARNKRNTPPGANRKFDTSVFITRKPGESLDSARTRKRRDAHAAKRGGSHNRSSSQGQMMSGKSTIYREDKAFDNVVSMLRKKHGESSVITKDSPKPKAQPRPKAKPQKPLTAKEKAQREVDAQYGRTPWNKKGSLGT